MSDKTFSYPFCLSHCNKHAYKYLVYIDNNDNHICSLILIRYPACCIRHHEPQVSIRCDQKAIFKSFLEDFALRMPSVCGCPLTFTSSTLYPTNSLHLASISKQSNLTRKPSLSKASQPFTFTMKKSLEVESTCSKVSNINNK